MKQLLSVLLVLTLLLGCVGSTAIAVTDEDAPVSRIDSASLAALEMIEDDAIVDVDIWTFDIDKETKRACLQKLIDESDSAFIRSCPAVDDLSELPDYIFTSMNGYDKYAAIFRQSRRLLYEEANNALYQELTEKYDIDATLVYASRFSPSLQLELSKADLFKIQYDEKIASICYICYYDNSKPIDPDNLFEREYRAYVTRLREFGNEYKELYYHRDAEGQVDWALVYFHCGSSSDEPVRMLAADRVIDAGGWSAIHPFEYAVYDVAKGEFITLFEIRRDTDLYPGLYDALWELNIGRPIGDADGDGVLTVLDATRIQRVLAKLSEIDEREDGFSAEETEKTDAGFYQSLPPTTGRFSDADGDGQITVLDATRVQRTLAKLCAINGTPVGEAQTDAVTE